MNKLLEKIGAGSLALGCQAQDSDTVEMLAYCGVDFIWADMMWGNLDWSAAGEIARACKAANIGCLVRAQAEPWLPGVDKRAIADCHRILTLGVTGAVLSVSGIEEVRLLVEVSKDWHRSPHVHPFTKENYQDYKRQVLAETLSIPLIEEAELFGNIEQVLDVEGLRAVWLGMSDLSRELGHAFDYEHPVVWAAVERTVELARRRGIVVVANVGWESPTVEAQIGRILRLWEHGVGVVSMQHIVQPIYQHIIGTARARSRKP
ncbi:MAG: hypothetical protein HY521_03060 [Proteobacteria bacterium]|nr:hypothetical protein [Pseudomonadota bacterium]